jgi:hypothetical protein
VRKVGVQMEDLWYCSYGCLRHAAESRFAHLLAGAAPGASRTERMPLALTLLSRGLLSTGQYKTAVEAQRESGEEIGGVITRLNFLSPKQITAVRAAQWGCPVFTRATAMSGPGVHIPASLMRSASMVPLHYVASTRKLLVGFAYGVEYGPLYAVEQVLDCTAQACFITPEEFHETIGRLTGLENPDELKFEERLRPAEMTRILCDYGALLDADAVVIRRCREFLWARLSNREKQTDLLFRVC